MLALCWQPKARGGKGGGFKPGKGVGGGRPGKDSCTPAKQTLAGVPFWWGRAGRGGSISFSPHTLPQAVAWDQCLATLPKTCFRTAKYEAIPLETRQSRVAP